MKKILREKIMKLRRKPYHTNQDGSVAVMVTVLIVVIIGFAALTFDVGYMASTKNELQNVADGAVLAAAGELGNMYATLSYDEQQSFVCDPTNIVNIAQQVGQSNSTSNPTGSDPVTILASDVLVGTWDPTVTVGDPFTPTFDQPDAVRVTVRRDTAANGPISTFFARIFNMNTADITATATAALTGQGSSGQGDMELPVGIPSFRLDDPDDDSICGDNIRFAPPNDENSCAGWTDLEDDPSVTPNGIADILDGSVESPQLDAGTSEVTFNNGKLNTDVFATFMLRFYEDGFDIDENGHKRLDANGTPVLALDNPGFDPTASALDEDGNPTGPAVAIYLDGCKIPCTGGCPATCEHGTPHAKYPPCPGGNTAACSGDLRYDHIWHTSVIVFDSDTCSPNTTYGVKGFTEVSVFNVIGPSEKMVDATILCNYVDPNGSRGGGGNYGKKGSIPGLVE